MRILAGSATTKGRGIIPPAFFSGDFTEEEDTVRPSDWRDNAIAPDLLLGYIQLGL